MQRMKGIGLFDFASRFMRSTPFLVGFDRDLFYAAMFRQLYWAASLKAS